MRAIEPVEIVLRDGVTRKLLFTNGSFKRLRVRFKLEKFGDIMAKESIDSLPALIYEGLVDKTGLSEEMIDDLIAAPNIAEYVALVAQAISGSTPPNGASSQTA